MSTFPKDPQDPQDPQGATADEHVERRLDEALEESFPASDSPAVSLRDDPPAGSRLEEPTRGMSRMSLITKVLAGGALAAAGVVVSRMLLRRSKGRIH